MIDETMRTGTDEHFTNVPRTRTHTTPRTHQGQPVVAELGELRLVRHSSFTAPANYPTMPRATSVQAAADILRPYAERSIGETFWVLSLDCNMGVIGGAPIETAIGTVDTVASGPREIFRAAIVAGARSILVAHYHPAGSGLGQPEPSDADVFATRALAQVGALLDIPVTDHLILGPDGCTSLAERGVIAEALSGEHPVSDLVQRGFSEFDAIMTNLAREHGQDPTPVLDKIARANAGRRARRGAESGT